MSCPVGKSHNSLPTLPPAQNLESRAALNAGQQLRERRIELISKALD